MNTNDLTGIEVAVIGMAARFPGAKTTDEFWNNLVNGVESISFFSDQELIESGVEPTLLENPGFVRTFGGLLEDKECFDSNFFGYAPSEAEVMAPQMRIFHECTWEALEDAGYDPGTYKGLIGLYAGASATSYWEALCSLSGKTANLGDIAELTLCNKDQMTCRISYNLNLTGPSFTFNTKCSTSLIAIHLACQGILSGECDIALAGAISINFKKVSGYIYQQGDIMAPDGHLRAFDAKSKGLAWSEGIGIVVLKSLEDALADRDHIYAVVKGSAFNNDGNRKVGYTAPSVEAQVDLIRAAHCLAEVEPESIGYIEAHGSGTVMGDPIEIKALKKAFNSDKKGFCRLGSVKSNVGHMVEAAGIGGFIKTALALKHKLIPPSLHFESPNPEIDFENSPFIMNARLYEWKNNGCPLRAGVSSFGIGGSNAHVILEEAPGKEEAAQSREWQLLLLSARTESALERISTNLAGYLKENPALNLADVAYTLQVGRKPFEYRKMLVCSDTADAARWLSTPGSGKVRTFTAKETDLPVLFVFSGLGGQYVNMGLELYRKEPVFREEMDRCFDILKDLTDYDIKETLYPGMTGGKPGDGIGATGANPDLSPDINQPEIAQLVIFIFEYALAKLLMQWGIKPHAMIGYSFGEYTAACLSGVFSLEESLRLILFRGKLIRSLPGGLMLSVPIGKDELMPLLNDELSIAIDNGPSCIAAGPIKAIEDFEIQMKQKKYLCMKLQASHALHSHMMEPILEKFAEEVGKISLKTPGIPYISNVTGTWIKAQDATDPGYWAKHLRNTVQFADGMKELIKESGSILVELGPGRDISTLVSRFIENNPAHQAVNLIRPQGKNIPDTYYFLNKIGHLWLYGQKIDWSAFYSREKRYRLPLPKYPFERQRFWFGEDIADIEKGILNKGLYHGKKSKMEDWFYIPTWKRSRPLTPGQGKTTGASNWLVFIDQCDLSARIKERLEKENIEVIYIKRAQTFNQLSGNQYTINPREENHYDELLGKLKSENRLPGQIVHLWSINSQDNRELAIDTPENFQNPGFHSLINIAQAVERLDIDNEIQITVLSNQMHDILGGDNSHPEQSTLLGAVKVIPLEYPRIRCQSIDVVLPPPGSLQEKKLVEQLFGEFLSGPSQKITAYRNNHRWIQTYEPYDMKKSKETPTRLTEKGVYLITGGLSGIGLILAEYLAKQVRAKLILTGRSAFPPRENWNQWLDGHDEEDSTGNKIRKIQELEKSGAEVLVFSTDVSNQRQMERVVARAKEQFGTINGVIHSAGVADGALIVRRSREMSEQVFSSKLQGTLVLNQVLEDMKLDFFVLCSSLTAITGGIGQAGYCAANAFLDAFAHWKNQKDDTYTVSINWDRWINVGIAAIAEQYHKKLTGEELTGGITAKQGVEAFCRILADGQSQVAVSRFDLEAHTKELNDPEAISFREAAKDMSLHVKLHPRPELSSEYAAPRHQVEQDIADIWQKLFGFDRIGIQDDFLELGGDSLKAISVISRVNKQLNTEVPLADFFKNPTIAYMSHFISGSETKLYSPVHPTEKKEYYALAPAQKRIFVLQQLEMVGTGYNLNQMVELEGNFVKETLEEIFRKLINRHESLRTSFHIISEEPVQVIHHQVEFSMEFYGLEPESANPESTIKHFIRPFDLFLAPLLRVGLITTGNEKHILMVDTHHIVSDGTSHGIFIKDFMTLYQANQLPGLKLQYKDFSEWQNKKSFSREMEKQEMYWLKRFEGEIPVLNLPLDYARPPVQSFEGSSLNFELSEDETKALNRIALQHKTTLYMALISIYYILLSKISGQEDIVVGTPLAGRVHHDTQQIIGMFVNTIVLRNRVDGEKSFTRLLEDVKKCTLEDFQNQDYQFEDLVEKIDINRDVSRNPLFDVMFIMQNFEIPNIEIPALKLKPRKFKLNTVQFDLILRAFQAGEKLYFSFEYCAKLFKEETIRRFIDYFKKIVSIGAENDETEISGINILSGREKQQVLFDFNQTHAPYPREKTVKELFEEQVGRTPNNTALSGAQQLSRLPKRRPRRQPHQLTYLELNQQSNQLAHLLRQKGVQPDTIVGIMMERSIEMMVGILGIIKSGAAYLPIDSLLPPERISYILEDSGASIMVTDKNPDRPINHRCKIVEAANGNLYGRDSRSPEPAAASTDLLYTIYTSGSTGRPKGVMIENRSMVNFIMGITGIIDIGVKDSILSLTTISFDIFGLEAILPLTTGAKVIIATEEEQLYPGSAARTMADECTNILQVTPSRLLMLISDEESPPALKSLKYLLVGGEALPAPLLEKAREAAAGRIYNLYGPTETTIWSTVKEVSPGKALNIGKPIANTRIYILAHGGTLKPLGAAGELYISGDGLARGYINNVQLTAAKFTRNPCEKNHRLYLTGDIARWLPDGNIEFFGRKDHQVKIRGFRIELSEIESQLVKHPGIKEAVVICRGDSGDKHLCAYIVSGDTGTGEERVEIADIKEYLSHTLPDYMIPAYFVLLEKIPLTPNGKIDRNALPSPEGKPGKEYAAPRNEIEKKLLEIWAHILNRTHSNLGIDDNFFELGGHSLKAIIMAAKIQKVFNIRLSLTEIFRNSTIRGMSRYLQKAGPDRFASIEPAEEREYYDLSSVQKRFYTLQQLEVDNTVYNISMFLKMSGNLNMEQTERIFRLLQQRHDSLRTSFPMINGKLVQRVQRDALLTMEYHESTREGAAAIVKNFVRPFDLKLAPLFRAGLIRVSPQQHILMVDMHHITADALCIEILIRDFAALNEGKKLPGLKLQYKDYCQWQNSDTQKKNLKKQKDYWLRKFSGRVPVLDLPIDFPRPPIQSFEGNCLHLEINAQQTDGLKKLARETGTTLYMAVLSVYYILLSKLAGQDDVVVGTVSAGRRHEDLRQIIGVFVNTLALAAQPKGSKTFITFLREVTEQTLEAFENQDINLEELMNDQSLKRDVSRNPLYDVFFELREIDTPPTKMEGLKYTPIRYESQTSMLDIHFDGVESQGIISFEVYYCIKLFKEETTARFISYFKELVTNILLNPEQKISNIEMLSQEEKRAALQQIKKKKTQPHLPLTGTMAAAQNAAESADADFDF